MNSKEKKYSPFFVIMLMVIYIGFLFYFVQPMLKVSSSSLFTPVETIYYESIDGDFLMVKDETVFNNSKTGGTIKYDEGTRLRRGVIKAGIANSDEYYEISEKISELEDTKSIFASEITDIDKRLRQVIISSDYLNLNRLINSFGYKVLSGGKFSNINQLQDEINLLKEKLASLSSSEVWNPAGIISYDMDGYEYLSIDGLDTIKYSEFNDLINRAYMDINIKEFKIIDNFRALFVAHFPDNEKLVKLNNSNIKISIDDQNSFFDARVIIPESYNTEGLVGFLVDSHIEKIYNIRRGKISVIFNSIPSFKIPTSSICEFMGNRGVVVKDVNGIIRFRPVEIYKEQKDFTYVSKGDERSMISIEDENIRTIVFYEEIILNPNIKRVDTIY